MESPYATTRYFVVVLARLMVHETFWFSVLAAAGKPAARRARAGSSMRTALPSEDRRGARTDGLIGGSSVAWRPRIRRSVSRTPRGRTREIPYP
jgi:hypothetical protein